MNNLFSIEGKVAIITGAGGVTLDEIRIDLGSLKKAYSTLPETKPVDASNTALK